MQTQIFGRTELQVSVIGFGGGPIGFLETDQQQVHAILNMLLDEGVNLVDTAAAYRGSEEAIGAALGHRRDEVVLVSKCGLPGRGPEDICWSPASLRESIDRSLAHLKTDRIDVMLLHSCEVETLRRGAALGVLSVAREAGKVRFFGYSGDNEAAAYAVQFPDLTVLETSVNICDQANIDRVLLAAQQLDTGVIAKRPIANAAWKGPGDQPGMYADYARTYADRFARMNLRLTELGFSGDPQEDWPEVALRFTLAQPGVHTAIIGTTNPEHARANLAAAARGPLPDHVVSSLRAAFTSAEAEAGESWPAQM
jgi:aryl-alcohol dehydrogenase-like predicted oxidoreductase